MPRKNLKRLIAFEADDGTLLTYAPHENGEGLVESNATVDPTAVPLNAYFCSC